MSGKEVVNKYLNAMFGGNNDFDTARSLLADNLKYIGPMLKAKDADEFINQMREIGSQAGPMKADIIHLIQEGNLVSALYHFEHPVPIYFSEWFVVEGEKIGEITIVHDTKAYS